MTICGPIPLDPPREWFRPPDDMPHGQKMTVERGPDGCITGRVAGYVAPWGQCLLGGDPRVCFKAPSSPTGYMGAMQGDTFTAEGDVLKTANIGGGINHVPIYPGEWQQSMVDHYAHTASQVMRVMYGEDDYGIWAAGALWPDATELMVAKVAASALSGDWRYRPEFGLYDMVGSQMVNVPGFPLIRGISAGCAAHPILIGGMGGVPAEWLTEAHMRTLNIERPGGEMLVVQVDDNATHHEVAAAVASAMTAASPACSCQTGGHGHGQPIGAVAAPKDDKVAKVVAAALSDEEDPKPGEEPADAPPGDGTGNGGQPPPTPPGQQAEHVKDPTTGEAVPDSKGVPIPHDPAKAGQPVQDPHTGEPVKDAGGNPVVHQAPQAPPAAPPQADTAALEQRLAAVEVKAQSVDEMSARVADLEAALTEQDEQLSNLAKWLAEEATKGLDDEAAMLPDDTPELPTDEPTVRQQEPAPAR